MNAYALDLTREEREQTALAARKLATEFRAVDDPDLLESLPIFAEQLPERSRRFLRHFGRSEPRGYALIRGHEIDDDRIGPTPDHWGGRQRPGPEFAEELLALLYASCLGEPFGWRTQQDAQLVHDVFPIQDHEMEQLGSGSKELLTWHTEDAFHPYRADYLVLGCLRNPQRVPTTIGELDSHELSSDALDRLFEERYFIKPDESHLPKNNSTTPSAKAMFRMIEEMNTDPPAVAVLHGSKERPYMRLDPYFMVDNEADPEASAALTELIEVLDGSMEDIVLDKGDFVFLNNHLVVHGRKPFSAKYDGTDRWLKRVNITTDLRRSRSMRSTPSDPIIG